ncbi:MAG: AMP-binding protein, partial [Blastocatellia bacterium]
LGVGPDIPVALFMKRGLEMVVGLLGVLKAGGAYVPLDPGHPKERLAYLIEDAQVALVLAQQDLLRELLWHDVKTVCLDGAKQLSDNQGDTQAERESHVESVTPENLACIIYTSGSTGLPKGVSLPHRALQNLIEWHRSTMLVGARVLQFASLSFEASIHEIFAAWSTGGAIILIPEEQRFDARALLRYINEEGIEKLILPVVLFQQMADLHQEGTKDLAVVKEITTTGEQMQITEAIVRLFNELKHCELHNHYGPSESHVVTALKLSGDADSWAGHPSIGTPIYNTRIYLADAQMSPVPLGVPGEICIGGVSLARGYWGRADLTAARFVPDSLGKQQGAR